MSQSGNISFNNIQDLITFVKSKGDNPKVLQNKRNIEIISAFKIEDSAINNTSEQRAGNGITASTIDKAFDELMELYDSVPRDENDNVILDDNGDIKITDNITIHYKKGQDLSIISNDNGHIAAFMHNGENPTDDTMSVYVAEGENEQTLISKTYTASEGFSDNIFIASTPEDKNKTQDSFVNSETSVSFIDKTSQTNINSEA